MSNTLNHEDLYAQFQSLLDKARNTVNNHSGLLSNKKLNREYSVIIDQMESLLKEPGQSLHLGGANLERRSRLLRNLSHEFRTPLTLIIGPLKQLLETTGGEDSKRLLSMMLRNAQRLLFLINQLLELAKFDNENVRLNASPCRLGKFIKGIGASFDRLARQKEVDLVVRSGPGKTRVYFDPQRFGEAMCNLVMNALRLTPPGGRVTVSVTRPSDHWAEISVKDTGPGIPADQVELVFDQFHVLNNPFEYRKKGFGIGLYLVREYIRLHRGTIDVKSVEGEGTEFTIRLPLGKEHLEPEEIDENRDPAQTEETAAKISSQYSGVLTMEQEEERRTPPVDDVELGAADGEMERDRDVVLVVEDSENMLWFIRQMMETEYRVIEAVNGEEGFRKAKEFLPDIIISDVVMPEMDGIQLCRAVKSDIATSHIPVILLTAKAGDEEVMEGLEAGADDYIPKPFDAKLLTIRVRNLIALRRRLQEKIQCRLLKQPEEMALSQLEDDFLAGIQKTIEDHLSDTEFTLDTLADKLYMSRATLYRKIVALTGQPPKKFIQAYRLKRSFELLRARVGNVTDVAYKVGFSSSAYFTKCFKERFHHLPSDYV